ncbi:21.7 kDa class VI heat shock protein isoform X2 [Salvia miltiorrhiza]|uniref:21.7 kDa class VI heat shock protein isoform X2 n=1 Tax=Salvia miltiorrhiza TaxID=226208 RepID=UPI0025AD72CD|nr:21.7 kDa class VI heat shock protein isoform X2 [Salvia miltiorrhiza]
MSSKQIEIQFDDATPQKWCQPLKEDVFAALTSKPMHRLGSVFSPLLFGKFFDPSDAFPLWEFQSDEVLPNSAHRSVDWCQTDTDFLLKADLSVENGKIMEISGQQKESKKRNWKSSQWWEHGYVRRIELPEHADWRKSEAYIKNDSLLEIRIPKLPTNSDAPQEN